MPGEHAGEADGPVLGYLRALQDLDRRFPGFSHDIDGGGTGRRRTYRVMCLRDGPGAASVINSPM